MLIVGGGIRSRNEFLLLLLAFGLWNIKMTQHGVRSWASIGFGFRAVGVGGAPGWFQNSGEFGIQMCVFAPIAGYFAYGAWPVLNKWSRRLLLVVIASALMSMIATSSRGAIVGIAAVSAWVIWRTPHRVKALVSLSVAAALIWLAIPAESKERFREIGDDRTSTKRLTYWTHGVEIASQHPLLGIGYRNWLPYYRAHYNPEGQLPHNFMVEAAAELGYLGALVVVWIMVASFRETANVRRRTAASGQTPDRLLWALAYGLDGALIGFAVSGFFVTVLYYPFLWMNTAMVMALARVSANSRAGARAPKTLNPSRNVFGRIPQSTGAR
jgi:O-antigen ligase